MSAAYQFKGKLITVSSKAKTLPNGRKTQMDVVDHPGAVLIVPYLSTEKIIMLHQYRAVLDTYLYELPAGTLNPQEQPLACASRELIEETGYESKRLTQVGRIVPVPGYSTELITIFKAVGLKKFVPAASASPKNSSLDRGFGEKDFDEVIRVCPMNQSQLRALFKKGRIIDAKTICALTFCGVL